MYPHLEERYKNNFLILQRGKTDPYIRVTKAKTKHANLHYKMNVRNGNGIGGGILTRPWA
jgi:hypothetical protein